MQEILITGGTGMIGRHITRILQKKGYTVKYYSRNPEKEKEIPTYKWDLDKQEADPAALTNTGTIIHLAGANVGDKRWTPSQKEVIIQSRTRSTALLHQLLRENDHQVKTIISASAIGYYGFHSADKKTEESAPGKDFMAEVTAAWEDAVDRLAAPGIRIVKLRIGVVLTMEGGALERIAGFVRYYAGAPVGNGKQCMSWVHLQDVCRMFVHAVETQTMAGPYNVVAPNPVSNSEFTKELAEVMHRPVILPNVPPFMIRLLFGEMGTMVLGGANVSSSKTEDSGFSFEFPTLRPALQDLIEE